MWHQVHSTSLQLAEAGIARHVAPWLWYDIILPVLTLPAIIVLGVIGALLVFAFRIRFTSQLPPGRRRDLEEERAREQAREEARERALEAERGAMDQEMSGEAGEDPGEKARE